MLDDKRGGRTCCCLSYTRKVARGTSSRSCCRADFGCTEVCLDVNGHFLIRAFYMASLAPDTSPWTYSRRKGQAGGPETDKWRLALCFRRLHSPHDTGTLSEREERPKPPAWVVLDGTDMMRMRD